jgi:type I site-specific restriction endonuclease
MFLVDTKNIGEQAEQEMMFYVFGNAPIPFNHPLEGGDLEVSGI